MEEVGLLSGPHGPLHIPNWPQEGSLWQADVLSPAPGLHLDLWWHHRLCLLQQASRYCLYACCIATMETNDQLLCFVHFIIKLSKYWGSVRGFYSNRTSTLWVDVSMSTNDQKPELTPTRESTLFKKKCGGGGGHRQVIGSWWCYCILCSLKKSFY